MPMVTTEAFDVALVDSAKGVGAVGTNGPLNAAKMILFTNSLTPTKNTLLADLTQPTFPGYAAAALTWSAVKRDAEGNISTDTGLVPFQMTDDTTPTNVAGYGITNTAGTVLYSLEAFESPFPLADEFSFLGIVAEWSANNDNPGTARVIS